MSEYVLNEWVWHDCFGHNGKKRMIETIEAMIAFILGNDKLCLVYDSPFFEKWAALSKAHSLVQRQFAGIFAARLLWTERCLGRCLRDLPTVPAHLKIKSADEYNIRLLLANPQARLVTTDCKLMDSLKPIRLLYETREAFVQRLLNQE